MISTSKFNVWYTAESQISAIDPAKEAFEAAVRKFSGDVTKDGRKQDIARSLFSIEDLRVTVNDIETKYTKSRPSARKWTTKLSQRIQFYGNVFDVLAQHHPEYVSLAWGAMKFVLTGVVNHENTLTTITKALAQIASMLPRVELVSSLYPTDRIIAVVSELYAVIIRFLIRAKDWFEESKLSRALHSITRPAELRYADLIAETESCSRALENLATVASQAELRDTRLELLEMRKDMKIQQEESRTLLQELKRLTIDNHSVILGHQLDTSYRLSDMQISQIITSMETPSLRDPIQALQYGISVRNKHGRKDDGGLGHFWLTQRFNTWANTDASTLTIIRSTFKLRSQLSDFGTSLVDLLFAAKIPVLWMLRANLDDRPDITVHELVKYLSLQALKITAMQQTECRVALSSAMFHSARTEEEWFTLLGSLLSDLEKVYIIVDTELLSPTLLPLSANFSFATSFNELFRKLQEHRGGCKVKVLLLSYGDMRFCRLGEMQGSEVIIDVGKPGSHRNANRSIRRGKGTRKKGWKDGHRLSGLMLGKD